METLVKPDNAFSIRSGQLRRKGLERLPPESLASIGQESDRNENGPYQRPPAPVEPTLSAPVARTRTAYASTPASRTARGCRQHPGVQPSRERQVWNVIPAKTAMPGPCPSSLSSMAWRPPASPRTSTGSAPPVRPPARIATPPYRPAVPSSRLPRRHQPPAGPRCRPGHK